MRKKSLTQTDLEQHLDTHSKDTIDDTEGEDERHGVDVQAEEPTERSVEVSTQV